MVRVLILFLFVSATSWACDPCALYHASRLQDKQDNSWSVSVEQQTTDYERTSTAGKYSQKSGEAVDTFSTTQVAIGYDLSERFGVQLNLPFIYREATSFDNYRSDQESDSGLGDIILSSNYTLYSYREVQGLTLIVSALAGLKLPTGDTGTLEELEQNQSEAEQSKLARHHPVATASGGRVLTFGTGSYDYIGGVNLYARHSRWLGLAGVQYILRTEGDYNYEFADDLIFDVGPGYYFWLDDDVSVASRIVLTGELKAKDHSDGELVAGSDYSNLYLGPEFLATFGSSILRVGLDFRMTDDEAESVVMPDTRLRAGLMWRF